MAFKILKTNHLPHSEIEIFIEASEDELKKHRKESIEHWKEHIELPGFRKGHVPEKMVVERVGEAEILSHAAEHTLQEIIPAALLELKIKTIGQPHITVTKIAPGNPFAFSFRIALLPEVKLPDYRSIAKKENATTETVVLPTEKEVNDIIEELRKNVAQQDQPGKASGTNASAKEIPALDDDFAKKFGQFKDLNELRAHIHANLLKEKEHKTKEKHRIKLAEAILSKTEADLPAVLIENELNRMEAQFRDDIERMGGTFEDYLKHIKKNIESVRNEWREDARRRALLQLVLHTISEKEHLVLNPKDVEMEVSHILEHYPGADPVRTRAYVETVITNETVFGFLETQK